MACVSQAGRLLIAGTFFDWLLRCQLSQFIMVCRGEGKTNSCHLSLGRKHAEMDLSLNKVPVTTEALAEGRFQATLNPMQPSLTDSIMREIECRREKQKVAH
ncbi:hypothetical protein IRJ41_025817 [Triplophysa rosa]|uniref:Uncharacterized protein n=1 Tax=Triplophysa rosa TaxID=992332 RepID=A0A9W7TP75_TRIRA|nr:hypothetical protein IRJ41_025817 [Triplophysa rosa]